MKISGICIVSKNVPKLAEFYEALFGIEAEGDENYMYFIIENTSFSICAIDVEQRIAPKYSHKTGNNTIVEIKVRDINAVYQSVIYHDMKIVKQLKTETFGATSFWVQDLDGNIISFIKEE